MYPKIHDNISKKATAIFEEAMSENIQMIYAHEDYFASFRDALDTVARERIYIEMIEAPPLDKIFDFQKGLIARNAPVYYAVYKERVVGWCDITPISNPRQNHRGCLGMGVISEYRHQGIGSKLLSAALTHARKIGLEKVELSVYTTNIGAIALYKKHGFEQEGLNRHYRKLDGTYFDCSEMAKFL